MKYMSLPLIAHQHLPKHSLTFWIEERGEQLWWISNFSGLEYLVSIHIPLLEALHEKQSSSPVVVGLTFNPNAWVAERGGSL